MAAKILPFKRFAIETHGFTDQVGAPQYNFELSQQRANSVLRYLTMQHKIPLHRISILGAGEEFRWPTTRLVTDANRTVGSRFIYRQTRRSPVKRWKLVSAASKNCRPGGGRVRFGGLMRSPPGEARSALLMEFESIFPPRRF